MDHRKLVIVVKQNPVIWDRNNPYFRDKEQKDKGWREIAVTMGFPAENCREAFKSLREKYIREREKAQQYGEYYREWDLLQELKYLDPHILPRKMSSHNDSDIMKIEDIRSNFSFDLQPENNCDFDKALIDLVKKTTPIWDRNSNTYPNKHLKNQMWQNIARALNKDINMCMLRWKALREKYIRQKSKFQDGDTKWELLDAMSFLDRVIQYRKRHDMVDIQNSNYSRTRNQSTDNSHDTDSFHINHSFEIDDNSYTDSSNDFLSTVKQESGAVLQVADSSFNMDSCATRKRSASINSEVSLEKKTRCSATTEPPKCEQAATSKPKTPEELFGDLVVAMLSKKPEQDRNLYMIEIMTVLSK